VPLHLLDSHFEERPISAQSYLRGCYRAGLGQATVETIGSKRSYALTWCMPNNDDDDDDTWKICCIELRNLANWPAELGKICRGKLWSVVVTHLLANTLTFMLWC